MLIESDKKRRKKTDPFVEKKITVIDYKDVALLRRFLSDCGKIMPRRVTGVNAENQRKLTVAIAREIALLPFVVARGTCARRDRSMLKGVSATPRLHLVSVAALVSGDRHLTGVRQARQSIWFVTCEAIISALPTTVTAISGK